MVFSLHKRWLSNLFGVLQTILFLFSSLNLSAQFGASKPVFYAGGSNFLERVQTADIDGDGDIDVLTKKAGENPIFWVKNDGHGNFDAIVNELPGSNIAEMMSIQPLDFDNDGDQDIVAAYGYNGKVLLWTNNGSGSFSTPVVLATGLNDVSSLTIIDFDKDGDADIAIARMYENSIYLENNRTSGTWISKPLTAGAANYLSFADANGDGVLDVFAIMYTGTGIKLNGVQISNFFIATPIAIQVVDIDRDGDLDVIAGTKGYSEGIIWLENKGGKYTSHVLESSAGLDYNTLITFDYDNDGDNDILAGCWFYCGIDLYENLGAGNFKLQKNVGSGGQLEQELAAADFDGDGKIDIAHNDSGVHIVVWQPNSATQFHGISSAFITAGHCESDTVFFKNTSRGKNLTSWQWNFGDGSPISTDRNPIHKYAAAGTYTPSLTVGNSTGGTDTFQSSISIYKVTKLDDRLFRFCPPSYSVSLDTAFTYSWYTSENQFFYSGSAFGSSITTEVLVTRTSHQTGCTSSKASFKFERHEFPMAPVVTDDFSYHGSADLMLKATSPENEEIVWTTLQGDSLSRGPYYGGHFDTTTTVYASVQNIAKCSSERLPVTAYVYQQPVPVPEFTWADATQSNSWSEGLDMVKDKSGSYLTYGLWSSDLYIVGTDTLKGNGKLGRFLTRYDPSGHVLSAIKVIGETGSYYQNEKLTVDQDNNAYISFYFDTPFTFFGIQVDPGLSQSFFVGKISPTGQYLWHTVQEGAKLGFAILSDKTPLVIRSVNNAVRLTKLSKDDGTFISESFMAMSYITDMAIDDADNLYMLQNNTIFKVASGGTLLWQKDVVQNGPTAILNRVVVKKNQGIVVDGIFGLRASEPTVAQGVKILGTPVGSGDGIFMAELTSSGNKVWARRITEPYQDMTQLSIDHEDNLFIASRIYQHSTLVKYDSLGRFQWKKAIASQGLFRVAPDEDGNAVVFGYFIDNVSLDQLSLTSRTHSTVYINYNVLTAKLGKTLKSSFVYDGSCVGQLTYFSDLSSTIEGAHLTAWLWTFGDGSTSTVQNPAHQYNTSGNFNVILKITDNLGRTITNSGSVAIPAAIPIPVVNTTGNGLCTGNEVDLSVSGTYALYKWSTTASTPSIPVSASGNYSVMVGSSDFCWSPSSTPLTIQFYPRPPAPAITPSDLEVCQGESISLTVAGTYPVYKWSNGSTVAEIVVNANGSYSLQAGSSSNCLSVASVPVNLIFDPLPVPSIEVIDHDLKASDGTSYNWYEDGVLMSDHDQIISPQVSGSYKVEITNEAGCSALSDAVTVVITGFENGPIGIRAWPNPAHDKLFISNVSLPARVTLLDGLGRVCMEGETSTGVIGVEHLPAGVYTVLLHIDGAIATRRVVKY